MGFASPNQFRSRADGMNRRKHSWACVNCRARVHVKIKACDLCGCKDFHYFGSAIEFKRYAELYLLMDHGQIRDLELQKPYPCVINDQLVTTYKADFVYHNKTGEQVIEDVKPAFYRDELYKLKKKLVEAIYSIKITEV